MQNRDDILRELNQRLKDTPRPPRVRLPDDGRSLTPGQLWSVADGCVDRPLWDGTPMPTWLLLLLAPTGANLFTAVPVFGWGELAGPNDVYVPERLAGDTLIAALELEATVDRNMICECFGRLPPQTVEFVLRAVAVQDDRTGRNAFSWGLAYLGRHDHRLAYHQAINDRLEELQASVRDVIFGEAATPLAFPDNLPWSRFCSRFVDIPVVGAACGGEAAADDGEEFSDCIIVPYDDNLSAIAGAASAEKYRAHSLNFDPIVPDDSDKAICCEWKVEATAKNPLGALVYVDGIEQPIGNAAVRERGEGLLVTLTKAILPPGAAPIKDARNLKIVILVKP